MKALTSLCTGALLSSIVLICPATAQAQQAPGIVEVLGCNFVNGSDAGDLARPMSTFNAWADEHNIDNYNVSTLTPIFASEALTNDVLFFNRWANASAMGEVLGAFYGAGGEDAVADFSGVVDCSSTTAFAAFLLQSPAEGRDGGPLQVFNCTVRENRTMGDGIGAINQWAEAAGDRFGTGHAVLLPLAGENPEATYTFKWLVLHHSYPEYGDSLAALFAPGAPALGDIIDPVMDCDSARVYNQVINRRIETD